jgi:hypothetical protein
MFRGPTFGAPMFGRRATGLFISKKIARVKIV